MSAYGTWLLLSDEPVLDLDPGAPYVYGASHVIPDPSSDVRAGWLEVGVVPNHVLAHHRGAASDIEFDDEALAEFKVPALRLGVSEDGGQGKTVVLDEVQVRALRDVLSAWLDAPVAW